MTDVPAFSISDPATVADPYPAFARDARGRPPGLGRRPRHVAGVPLRRRQRGAARPRARTHLPARASPRTSGRRSTGCTRTRCWRTSRPSTRGCSRLVAEGVRPRPHRAPRGRASRSCARELLDGCEAKLRRHRHLRRHRRLRRAAAGPRDRRPARRARVRRRSAAPVVAGHREDVRVRPHAPRTTAAPRSPAASSRRTSPSSSSAAGATPGDDLVTHLAQVEAEGEKLTERELAATVRAAAQRRPRGHGQRLRQRHGRAAGPPRPVGPRRRRPVGLAATAVEEMLRYDTPSHLFERTAHADVEIAGATVPRGPEDRGAPGLGQPRPRGLRRRGLVRRRPRPQPAHRVRRRHPLLPRRAAGAARDAAVAADARRALPEACGRRRARCSAARSCCAATTPCR